MKTCLALAILFAASIARAEIAASPETVRPLQPPAEIPDVAVTAMDGKNWSLRDALAGQPTVFVVYRGGWCPYCTKQLGGLQKILPELHQLGYRLVALSPDPVEELNKTLGKETLDYTLFSDSTFAAVEALGLAFRLDAKTIKTYNGYGIPLYSPPGATEKVLPVPAVFLTDREGRLTFTHTNPDYTKRLSTKALLDAARSKP
jgi:peroxiredoxin